MRQLVIMATCFVLSMVIGMIVEASLLGDPHPFAWGHRGIGTAEIANKCSDDDGKTWWPARQSPDGGFACFDADKPSWLSPFSIIGKVVKDRAAERPSLGFGEAVK